MEYVEGLVSVIVVTLNRKYLLGRCIASVKQQSYRQSEIIVVDDHSEDGTSQYIAAAFSEVVIYRNKYRYGPSYSRNRGIIKSRGQYLLFLDSDTELICTEMIENMVAWLRKHHSTAEVGGEAFFVAGALLQVHGVNVTRGGDSLDTYVNVEGGRGETNRQCTYVPTSNCMVEKKRVLEAGGFDPYFVYPSEDKDFGYRLQRRGYRNFITSRTGALHTFSSEEEEENRFYYVTRNRMRFLIKNHSILCMCWIWIYDLGKIYGMVKYRLYRIKIWIEGREEKTFQARGYTQEGSKITAYLRAYGWNITQARETVRCRNRNFLSDDEMRKFEKKFISLPA